MAFRFCLIVCLVAPPVSWGAMDVANADAGCSAVGTPSGAQLVRETAKTEKTPSTWWLAIASVTPIAQQTFVINIDARPLQATSRLDLDAPPLAPRPPPLS